MLPANTKYQAANMASVPMQSRYSGSSLLYEYSAFENKVYVPDWSYHYPTGIPHNYSMVHDHSGLRPEYYTENYVPISFYQRDPATVKAVFSTENGKHQPRQVKQLNVCPASRSLRLWDAEKLQNTANSIRKKFWANMRDMKTPTCWDDLYAYFDAQDIFSHGPLNLWNLLNLLCHENRIIMRDLFASMCFEVGVWSDEWLEKEGNKEKLLACDTHHTDILSVLSDEEQKEVSELREVDMAIVRGALAHRQEQLLGYERALARPFPANGLEVAWSNYAIHNWLGKYI